MRVVQKKSLQVDNTSTNRHLVSHNQSGCAFVDEIRGMAQVFGRHMLASNNNIANGRHARAMVHVAQDTALVGRELGPL